MIIIRNLNRIIFVFFLVLVLYSCKSMSKANAQKLAFNKSNCYLSYPKHDSIRSQISSKDYLVNKNTLLVDEFLGSELEFNLLVVNTVSSYDVYQDVKLFFLDKNKMFLKDEFDKKELKKFDVELLSLLWGFKKNISSYCDVKSSAQKSINFYFKIKDKLFYVALTNSSIESINTGELKDDYKLLKLFEQFIGEVKIK